MARAAKKKKPALQMIEFSRARDIPFNRIRLSADNAREMLRQNEHALERLDDGTYGICESCGQPIGKLRLQAAPRATLCMPCKQKEERR